MKKIQLLKKKQKKIQINQLQQTKQKLLQHKQQKIIVEQFIELRREKGITMTQIVEEKTHIQQL